MSIKFVAVMVMIGALSGCGGGSSSSVPTGTLFVTTQADTKVSHFEVNLVNGKLNPEGPQSATGSAPAAMVITQSAATFAFVANSQCINGNQNCNSISRYAVDSSGTFTELAGPQGVGISPVALALNSASTLLFVANRDSDSVSVLTIQSDATLTPVAGSPFATGAGPVALAVAGNFLYVANSISSDISAYSISSKGVLTPVLSSPFTGRTATIPSGIAASPSGNFVYVSNFGSNNVSAFSVCNLVSTICPLADGSLVELPSSPFTAGTGPGPMALDSTGHLLYVIDTGSDQLSGYRVDTTTGDLTPNGPSTVPTGAGPAALAIHPNGLWLYTANYNAGTISGFEIDPATGLLTPQSTVTTSGQPAALVIK